jgi:hypothetical protein
MIRPVDSDCTKVARWIWQRFALVVNNVGDASLIVSPGSCETSGIDTLYVEMIGRCIEAVTTAEIQRARVPFDTLRRIFCTPVPLAEQSEIATGLVTERSHGGTGAGDAVRCAKCQLGG